MKRDTFTQVIKSLEVSFGKKMTKEEIEIYWEILKGYEDKEIKNATIKCIKELTFFPRIADIIRPIGGDTKEESELAWLYLKEKIEDDGYYSSVSFPKYPAVGAVVEALGGWLRITDMKENEETWIKKEFIVLYPILKKNGEYPKELAGFLEIENNNKGYSKKSMLESYSRDIDGKRVDRELLEDPKVIRLGIR